MYKWYYGKEMEKKTIHINSLQELAQFAHDVLHTVEQKKSAVVITLTGDLGVGKTAFVKTLAKQLGVTEEVTSPTFAIMKTYKTTHQNFSTLTHIDAYRIEDVKEMEVLRYKTLEEDGNRIICIEWPEHMSEIISKDVVDISFTLNKDESRDITYAY